MYFQQEWENFKWLVNDYDVIMKRLWYDRDVIMIMLWLGYGYDVIVKCLWYDYDFIMK